MAAAPIIGQPLNRVDGDRKVTGRANYAADNRYARTAHGYGVMSSIASGEIIALDTGEAEKAPGVLAVFHADHIPPLARCPEDMEKSLKAGETRTPFEDRKIHYAGQFVALVVAETFAQARRAAQLVRVRYRELPPTLTIDAGMSCRNPAGDLDYFGRLVAPAEQA